MTPRLLMDMQWLHKDAIALIQQLQAQNAEQAERIKQLEAERDAAVVDIRLAFTSYVGACQSGCCPDCTFHRNMR